MARPVKACIFDLDGLLIDSERVYTLAGAGVAELLRPYGVAFTYELKAQMMGRPAQEATQMLIDATRIPLTVAQALQALEAVEFDLFTKVQPLPGAMRLLRHLHAHGIPMAIATGSRRKTFDLKTGHLPDLLALFPPDAIVTADQVPPGRGKPQPDVFQMAAQRIDAKAEDCLVFEDGLPGIEAARRAGMASIWVPDVELRAYRQKAFPDVAEDGLGQAQILTSLEDFEPERWGLPPYPVQANGAP